ncbi:acyltransferase [Vibrio sp. S/42/10]|uniref:acyltransferase n=1 Tax=Vibrio sp. S/42/10 TaxID=2914757 RepID=UPI0024699723|nr:acyltransferase [Vibrio sp. S/42/10]MDH5881665.1 acyltransferase [Vibrio sp. S/42/10]
MSAIFNRIYSVIFGKVRFARKLGVKVGQNCRIYIRDWGSEPFLIDIGDNVTIAANTRIINHDGSPWIFRTDRGRYFYYDKVTIKDNVFVGMNCTILPGVTIGSNVIVGAGTVVTKDLSSGYVYAGNPAKIIKPISGYIEKMEVDFIHSDRLYEKNYKERVLECIAKQKKI